MRIGWILAAAAVCLALGASAPARAGDFGVGVNAALPAGDFGDLYKSGFGIHALLKRPVTPLATITADVGWTSFNSEDLNLDLGEIGSIPFSGDNIDVWNFTGGAKVNLLPLGLGLEYGYFTKVDEWGLVPFAGMGFSKLDLTVRYKATGDAKWWELRVGLFF